MSLLRDHFKKSFNIGYKIAKGVVRKNDHGQEVKDWEVSGTVYDAYYSTLKNHSPNHRVDTNDQLYMDIATHKVYSDVDMEEVVVGDKLIIVGGIYNKEELEVVYITPQRDEKQEAVDHLILYVKNIRNVRR